LGAWLLREIGKNLIIQITPFVIDDNRVHDEDTRASW